MTTRRKDRTASGAAITGAGAVTAGTGLVAGGVPGAKADFSSVFRMKPSSGTGVKRAVTTVTGKAPVARALPGGILGFRQSAHRGGLAGFSQMRDSAKKTKSAHEAFFQGRNAGKIAPEEKVLSHMSRARGGAAAALIGGTAVTAYGVHRSKTPVRKSQRSSERYNGALAGVGAGGLAVSAGGTKALRGQQRHWEKAATKSVDEAGKLVPNIAGREGKRLNLKQMHQHKIKNPGQPFPKTMYPKVTDSQIKRDPKIMAGVKPSTARRAGELRGAAAQQRHFAEVYGNTAKVVGRFRAPSAIVGAAGVGGLMAARRKKSPVSKSAFGVEHGVAL